ncbi:MAG: WG repeat-containing protein, partial [Duncaniella sp.]|nr:WG repeat-containing protein [Duncaniella sp.]
IVSVKGRKGIVNPDGVYIQKPEISEVKPLGAEGYMVMVKGKQGFLSPEGTTVVPPLYTSVDPRDEGYFIVNKGGKAGLLTRDGDILLDAGKYTGVERFGEYWKIAKGKNRGIFDATKKAVLLEANYADVLEPVRYSAGVAFPVMKNNRKWGAVNSNGKELIKFKNQDMTPLGAIRAIRVRRNSVGERLYMLDKDLFLELDSWKSGNVGPFNVLDLSVAAPSLNTPDNMVVGLSFGEHIHYSDNYDQRKAAYNGLPGKSFKVITDSKGNALGNDPYDILPLGSNWLAVSRKGPWMVYDREGNPVVETEISGTALTSWPNRGSWYSNNHYVIFPDLKVYPIKICNDKLRFVDKDGKGSWIPLINDTPRFDAQPYDDVSTQGSSIVFVKRDGLWGMYRGDRELFEPGFDALKILSRKDYLEVKKDGAIGLYHIPEAKWIIPLSLNVKAYEFHTSNPDSPILISNGKWGLMSAGGEIQKPMTMEKDKILDILKPKKVEPVKTATKQQPKSTPKPAKSDTQFQESKNRRF